MNERILKNLPASIRQKLLNKAKAENRPFNELLQYYASERFLYRLSKSAHADRFVLKGALMLRVWRSPESRSTMDIDMLGSTSNNETDIIAQFRDILGVEVDPDGLVFNPDSIRTESIAEDADYQGIRVRLHGQLDSARINIQIDIGFSDVVFPEPEMAELPTIIELPAPKMLCYTRESSIAEKLNAMIKLGELNSRMKDFYDIWLLARQFDFDGILLSGAIVQTFGQRKTDLPDNITAFTAAFVQDKQVQWKAFHRRLKQETLPEDFAEVVIVIRDFLIPVISALNANESFSAQWTAADSWSKLDLT